MYDSNEAKYDVHRILNARTFNFDIFSFFFEKSIHLIGVLECNIKLQIKGHKETNGLFDFCFAK